MISAFAMHHVPDPAALIQSFADHLQPVVSLALAALGTEDGSFHPDEAAGVFHHGFDRGELQKMLEKRGLRTSTFSQHTQL